MGDEESANRKRKRAEEEALALRLSLDMADRGDNQAEALQEDAARKQEAQQQQPPHEQQREQQPAAQEAEAEDDRGSNASTTATAEDEAVGRERARVRRLLEPFAREQLLEILTNAYVEALVWLAVCLSPSLRLAACTCVWLHETMRRLAASLGRSCVCLRVRACVSGAARVLTSVAVCVLCILRGGATDRPARRLATPWHAALRSCWV